MTTYTYSYTVPVSGDTRATITPCGTAALTVASVVVDVPDVAPFYVHKLTPLAGQPTYHLADRAVAFLSLEAAIAAQLDTPKGDRV